LHCFWDILTVPWCVHPLTQCTLLSAQDSNTEDAYGNIRLLSLYRN
jgi:hypothetical protein